jgi:hypothetical protein
VAGHICPSKNIFEDVSYTWESRRGKKATWRLAALAKDSEMEPKRVSFSRWVKDLMNKFSRH